MEKGESEGGVNKQTKTPTAYKEMERTSSEGLASESGKYNIRSKKFGAQTQKGRKHRESGTENMDVLYIRCMSCCKGWMNNGVIRYSNTNKGPGVLSR